MGRIIRWPSCDIWCCNVDIMTSSMETFSDLLALCENSPVTGEFPSQRPLTRSLDVFIDLRLNKRLSKPSRRQWFETQSRPLWRHCNDISHNAKTTVRFLEWSHNSKINIRSFECVMNFFVIECLNVEFCIYRNLSVLLCHMPYTFRDYWKTTSHTQC